MLVSPSRITILVLVLFSTGCSQITIDEPDNALVSFAEPSSVLAQIDILSIKDNMLTEMMTPYDTFGQGLSLDSGTSMSASEEGGSIGFLYMAGDAPSVGNSLSSSLF